MEKIRGSSIHSDALIIIGSPEAADHLRKSRLQGRVFMFEDLAHFDTWRASRPPDMSLESDVHTALVEVGYESLEADQKLIGALVLLQSLPQVPDLDHFIARLRIPRRTFFRLWREGVKETPARFFSRVRLLHTTRLIQSGNSPKQAAWLSGFSSVEHYRRKVTQRRARNGESRGTVAS